MCLPSLIAYGCGEDLGIGEGSLQSPNYPNPYPHNLLCSWNIALPFSDMITINIQDDFMVEGDGNWCFFDFLSFYDAKSGMLIAELCGEGGRLLQGLPNSIIIVFKTDEADAYKGFYLSWYTELECGEQQSGREGMIISPNYPHSDYPFNAECVWTIQAPEGTKIGLNYTDFDVEHHPLCVWDYVKISDGVSLETYHLFCGNGSRFLLVDSNHIRITFVSDGVVNARGFALHWNAISCGNDLYLPQGSLSSPNFPQNYADNLFCAWKVTIVSGIIDFDVTHMEIEGGIPWCFFDSLSIYDTYNGTELAILCGDEPVTVIGQSNSVVIVFRTDNSVSYSGWELSWPSVGLPSPTPPTTTPKDDRCIHAIEGTFGILTSPGYPERYPSYAHCEWNITVPFGSRVGINITDMRIPLHENCEMDSIQFFDQSTGERISQQCGDGHRFVISTSRSVRITFSSSSEFDEKRSAMKSQYGKEPGWALYWSAYGCGEDLGTGEGSLQSPNYPNPYPHNLLCSWNIALPFNDMITINIQDDFMVEGDGNWCFFDFLSFYDAKSGVLIAELCGEGGRILQGLPNSIIIVFKTDEADAYKGFYLSWYTGYRTTTPEISTTTLVTTTELICGEQQSGLEGMIASPNYPHSNYSFNTECVWTIQAPEGTKIGLNYTDFEVEYHPYCVWDYVKISDGVSLETYHLFCGNGSRFLLVDSNHIRITFVSNGVINARGFALHWNAISCGSNLNLPQGSLSSPNFPQNYADNLFCAWKVTIVSGIIDLDVTHMEIEGGIPWCFFDSLSMYDTYNGTELAILCGDEPVTVIGQSNSVVIVFRTDSSVSYSGWELSWPSVGLPSPTPPTTTPKDDSCIHAIEGTFGILTSPGYPERYPSYAHCEWNITVPDGSRVGINITDMRIPLHENCEIDSLQFFDQSTGERISQQCGDGHRFVISTSRSVRITFNSSSEFDKKRSAMKSQYGKEAGWTLYWSGK
ncbi:cubilin-like [Watersipora subatra]|uniref:cubilin-like n=1 Tax=Watersipora subatra TaxID=2589382 RepID=UPI00355C0F48